MTSPDHALQRPSLGGRRLRLGRRRPGVGGPLAVRDNA